VPSGVLIPYPLSQFRVLLLEFWGGSWIAFVLPFFLSSGAGGPFGIRSRAPCGTRGAQAIGEAGARALGEAGTRPVKRRQPGRAAGACGGSALWRSAQASGSRAAALGNVARDPRPGGQVSRRRHGRLCIAELRSARLARVGSSRRRLWLLLLLRRRWSAGAQAQSVSTPRVGAHSVARGRQAWQARVHLADSALLLLVSSVCAVQVGVPARSSSSAQRCRQHATCSRKRPTRWRLARSKTELHSSVRRPGASQDVPALVLGLAAALICVCGL